jgi:hypothetical protein
LKDKEGRKLYPMLEKGGAPMKTKKTWRFVSIATLVAVLWCFISFYQMQAHAQWGWGPTQVQFVGIFYPPEQKEKVWRMNTITVNVKNKKWLFVIKRAVDLTGGMDEFEILENIWPAILTFRGSDNLIDPLLKPDIAGKRFAIQGTLYFSDSILQVNSVVEVTTKKEKKEKKE